MVGIRPMNQISVVHKIFSPTIRGCKSNRERVKNNTLARLFPHFLSHGQKVAAKLMKNRPNRGVNFVSWNS